MNKKEIQKIYQEFRVPKHVIAHMQMVALIAKKLTSKMQKKGHDVDEKLLENAALLHDVVRCVDFKSIEEKNFTKKPQKKDLICWQKLWKKYHKIGHEKAMAQILRKKGEHKLANLIAKHGFFSIWKLKTIEEKILYYADKRVDRDKIVSLKKRFSEGKKRNMSPNDDLEFVKKTEEKVFALEREFVQISGETIDQF